jgi:ribonuclease HII
MLKTCFHKYVPEAGCDEAGRGCLAGPVFAAAVILPKGFYHPGLDDSKKLTEKQRTLLRVYIERHALAWAVAAADNLEIDRINILRASILAMHRAISLLPEKPGHLIIDGNYFESLNGIPYHTIIRGDSEYASIAAASVMAKTSRDVYMKKIHAEYHCFGWDKNKGYPTSEHRKAIERYGITEYHRRSFRLLSAATANES